MHENVIHDEYSDLKETYVITIYTLKAHVTCMLHVNQA
jgi:hypothetical protein